MRAEQNGGVLSREDMARMPDRSITLGTGISIVDFVGVVAQAGVLASWRAAKLVAPESVTKPVEERVTRVWDARPAATRLRRAANGSAPRS